MIRSLMLGVAASALAAGVAGASAAWAADETKTSASTEVGEVVVTAERRAESEQKVAISMTVLSAEALNQEGVVSINGLQNASPSLEIQPAFGGGAPQFRLRGVGFQDYGSNNAPTVGVYINEVAYPIPVMTQGAFFDIARVEVLRGPQGTLYGRNTTGGAVNVITNQPTSTFHAGAEIEYGSYGQVHAEGFISGPVMQNLDMRLAAFTDQGGAYEYNRDTLQPFGNARRYGLRWLTDWQATDKLDIKFEYHGLIDNSDGNGLYLFSPLEPTGPVLQPADTNHFATGWGLDPQFAADIGAPANSAPFKKNAQDGASVNTRYDLGFADLVNIASYDFMNRREFQDWSSTDLEFADVFFHTRSQVFADELRLVSHTPGPFSYVGGVYVSYQNMNEAYLSDFLDIYGISAGVHYNQKATSEAVFGQAKYEFTSKLSVTGGLRFENEIRSLNDFNTVFLFGTAPVGGLAASGSRQEMNPLTGKIEADYKPQDDLMLYASLSRGVKSGGFTVYNTANVQSISPFAPEKLIAYEWGYKWTLPYAHLHFNGSGFHYDYYDEQVLSDLYTPPENGNPAVVIGHFVNAPKSHIDGGELELTGEVLPHLSLSQQVGYKIGKFDDFPNFVNVLTGQPQSQSGNNIPFPKLTYSGDVSYWVGVGGGYKVEAEGNYSYHGFNPSPLPLPPPTYDIPAYWLVNVNLTLTPPDAHWALGFWCQNLFNQQYDLVKNFFIPGINIASPGAPRTIGLKANYSF